MKKTKLILTAAVISSMTINCKNSSKAEVKTVESGTTEIIETSEGIAGNFEDIENYAAAEFTIKGMTCAMGCAKTIEKKLAKTDGVFSAKVDFENELANVEFDADKIDKDALNKIVTGVSNTYSVHDMKISDQPFSVKKK
ncbi:MAG: heavy metal-associated domain-containing protein [Bacteroidetes bacterium]|nr:heavy metal-associated domain-containing protein [Bacteroidota bacterium]MDA0860808.1 heavy metal-associated domain-containing protein [Bacteroidota bacterium]MDA1318805.1 heavy metal-associated domain-containing protein [Bacteroidota bacterium]